MAKWLQFLAVAFVVLPSFVEADLATVHLADGRSMTVELVLVERGQVQWKNPANPAEAMKSFLRSEIEYVDFPPTGLWKSAEDDFQSGNISAAGEGYQAVAAARDDHFYPMPGNFSSLALVRLLEIRRIQLDAKLVAAQYKTVREEWGNLPPDYRVLDPVTAAWIATSEEKWEKVLEELEKVESPGPESYFLRGRATEALGRPEEAIQHYAGAYVLNFGGFAEITRQSLRRSIDLLAASDDKNRRAELQAQAKLYRDLFGKGKLWDGAPEWVVELAGAEIENAKADIDQSEMENPGDDGGTVAEVASAAATLPAKEDREWLLYSEVEKKVYLMTDPDAVVENLGGVKKTAEGYELNGSSAGLKIDGINGQSKFWVVKTAFTPLEADGVLFDLTSESEDGFGFYLRGSKLIAVWNPVETEMSEFEVGPVEIGRLHTFFFRVNQAGELRYRLDEFDHIDTTVAKDGLGLGAKVSARIGDIRSGDNNQSAADGNTYTPFKGGIQYFAIGAGQNSKEVVDVEREYFGGKPVRLFPPGPEPDTEEKVEE